MGAPSDEADSSVRRLGLPAATAVVVSNMVGTGVFVSSGLLARELGDARLALFAWVVGGLLALLGASVYAELGAMFPRAGGEYVYLSRALHPSVGFVSGCVSIAVGFAASIAASAVACASHLHAIVPSIPVHEGAVALILIPTAVHGLGVSVGARAQTLVTALETLLLLAFAFAALVVGEGRTSNFDAGAHASFGSGRFALALVFVSFAYSGFGSAGYLAGELREPVRTLPRALLAGTALVTALYVVLNVAFFYGASPARLAEDPAIVAHVAARELFGPGVGAAISAMVALALFSSISGMVLAGPRVPMAMAEDGLFFASFARRGRGGSPTLGLAAQALVAVALVLTSTFEALLTYVGFLLGVFSALTAVAAMVLRSTEPALPRPYRAPLLHVSAGVFAIASAWVVIAALRVRPEAGAYGALTVLVGLVLYGARRLRGIAHHRGG
ncbi:MAG: amino acid permease [Polyangiales bacterium]